MENLTQKQDADLVQEFMNGNENSFNVLISRHKNDIFKKLRKITNNDIYRANEYCQEVIIKIYQKLKLGKYKESGKFLPWSLRVARNYFLDQYRKETNSAKIKPLENIRERNVSFNEEEYRENLKNDTQIFTMLHQNIDFLSDVERKTVELKLSGKDFKTIALEMNCNINTALARHRYAVIKLRQLMPIKNN